ncbi:HNH endonuclease [Kitasatospora sp. NPDC127111]|uniref:HNH endonuclease n=1 Tax=Kitasatospora sp. NPDC127111 TaxID=3345363 RepID=UPI00362E8FC0
MGWFGCFYCDGPLTVMELDHVIPLSRGGADATSNLVPACSPCNGTKSNQPASLFVHDQTQPTAIAVRA